MVTKIYTIMTLAKTKKALRENGGLQRKSLFPTTSFFNDIVDYDFPRTNFWDGLESRWLPSANIKEDNDKFVVEMLVPGMTKKDIHVEIDDNNMLCISAEKKEESEEKTENYTRKEFSYGTFKRNFDLPVTIDKDKVAAKCNDGILTVELPKKEEVVLKSQVKEIEIA